MSKATDITIEPDADDDDGLVWGMESIGKKVNRTASQARYLYDKGFFGDAVRKVGHRTFVGSSRKLRHLSD